jgi:hypothetical protein
MVNLTPSAGRIRHIEYFGCAVYEHLIVDMNDILTLDDFLSTINLSQALLINNADGSAIATTISLNTVIVTGAATDADCTLFAYGRQT